MGIAPTVINVVMFWIYRSYHTAEEKKGNSFIMNDKYGL